MRFTACVGPVTPVCPPFPQVNCRPQRDLFGRSGRPGTFLRTTSTRIRGNSSKRHGGSNRQPCSCHASRHPTGRHPSLTHPLWVPRACWTGPFGRRSSRWWPPRRTSRNRWSRELVLVRGRALTILLAWQIQGHHRDRAEKISRMGRRAGAWEGPRGIERARTDFRACTGLPAWVINLCTT